MKEKKTNYKGLRTISLEINSDQLTHHVNFLDINLQNVGRNTQKSKFVSFPANNTTALVHQPFIFYTHMYVLWALAF